jgi:SAM-dependent methyltransferase
MILRFVRQWVLELLRLTRGSGLRRPILHLLVWLHNTSYHLISYYASPAGKHPKHDIQKYHEFFLRYISSTDRVLDVGCGQGEVAYDVAAKAAQVTAVDIEPHNIARAKEKYSHRNLIYLVADATTHRFESSFDVIILSNVLEHIKDRVEFLQKLSGLAPIILIRVPMITRDWISVYKKNEGFEYRLDDTHYIEYDESIFRGEMAAAGLAVDHLHVNFGELYAVVKRRSESRL